MIKKQFQQNGSVFHLVSPARAATLACRIRRAYAADN
jgi:hypothetical protein